MADITDYVDLTITIQDAAVSIPNFGALCVVGHSPTGDAGLTKIAANSSGLTAYVDTYGGATTDAAYKMLSAVIAQDVHTDDLYWYNNKNEPTVSLTLTPQAPFTEGKVYSMKLNGVEISYKLGAAEGAAEISTSLHTQAAAITGVSSVDNTGSFTLSEASSSFTSVFLTSMNFENFECETGSSSANDMSDDLDAALKANSDLYGFVVDVDSDTELADAAAWALTNKKLMIVRTKDTDSVDGNGLLDTVNAANNTRCAVFVSDDDNGRADAALMGQQLGYNPGEASFFGQRLNGVTASTMTSAQIAAIKAKNGITFTETRGVAFTDNNTTGAGRTLELQRNVDWLQARIEQNVLTEIVNNTIIIMSDEGIAIIEKAIKEIMVEAEQNNVILPGWELDIPKASEITSADAAAGILRGFDFRAVAAVAAKKIIINGTLSLAA